MMPVVDAVRKRQPAARPAASHPLSRRAQGIVLSGLSFVAGFVDATGFIALFGVFTAHVTGNIATLASQFITPSAAAPLKLAVIFSFMAGAAITGLAADRPGASHNDVLRRALAVEVLWLALLLGAGLWLGGMHDPTPSWAWIEACVAGAAMGGQNAMSKLPTGMTISSAAMTSDLAQWSVLATHLVRLALTGRAAAAPDGAQAGAHATARAADRQRALATFVELTFVLAAFAAGAAAGALAWTPLRFSGLAAPLAIVVALRYGVVRRRG